MDDSGSSYSPVNPTSSIPVPLKIEERRLIRERITSIPGVGHNLMPVNTNILGYCAKFYHPDLDPNIKIGLKSLLFW